MSDTVLTISWSVSRGRETYGYNICRLDDQASGERFRCMGGGYDMVGTVVGEWLQVTYGNRLREIANRAYYDASGPQAGYRTTGAPDALYGMTRHDTDPAKMPSPRVTLDGACGIESILRIGEAIGLTFARTYKTHGRSRGVTTGWVVTDTRPDAA